MRYLALLFVLLSSALYANECCCERNFSFYIGGVLGASFPGNTYTGRNEVGGDTHFATFGGVSGIGGGVVGVQTYCCNWLFAGQVNVLGNSLDETARKSTNTSGIANHQVYVKNAFQWGADLRLGYRVCGATPYLLGGFESGRWQMGLGNFSAVSNRGIPANTILLFRKNLYGGKVGCGMMVPLCSRLVLNMEGSYVWFGKIQTSLVDSVTLFTWSHKENIQQGTLLAGLNWLF